MEGTLKILGKIVSTGDAHNSWIWKGLTWIGVFIAPVKPLMVAIGTLIIIDLVLGVWAAVKKKEKITSRGLSRTITKLVTYQLAIISSLIMESYFAAGIPIVKIISGLIAITEFKSILENTTRLTGINFWEIMMKRIIRSVPKKKISPPSKKKKTSRKKSCKSK